MNKGALPSWSYTRAAWLLALGLLLLLIDFLSKAYVYHLFPANLCGFRQGVVVFQNVLGVDFSIDLTVNRGAAWGILANFQIYLMVVRIAVVFGLFVYLFFFNIQRRAEIPLLLIIVGAIGNIVDYFLYGFVIDFFHFNLWGYHFPVFNFADSFITIGVCLLLILTFFQKKTATV